MKKAKLTVQQIMNLCEATVIIRNLVANLPPGSWEPENVPYKSAVSMAVARFEELVIELKDAELTLKG